MTQLGNNQQQQIAALTARMEAVEGRLQQVWDWGMSVKPTTDALPAWQAGAVQRVTATEQALEAGSARLAALEAAAKSFEGRVHAVEQASQGEDLAVVLERLASLEGRIGDLDQRLTAMGQVARPGRTVLRQQLDQVKADLAEVLKRLPPVPDPAA